MAPPAISGISMAFASPSSSLEIAKPYPTNPAISFAAAKFGNGIPLTPPNSVSPNLPAQATRAGLSSPPPIQIDGDIDLQDAVEHAAAQDQPPVPLSRGALSGLDASQSISASMLAKHHLPNIILGHGPVAIRHVMACLTHSLPGFSRIPPAKARRLVVAALESRAGGGLDGNITFEKVGWGRWDAHTRGDQSRGSSFVDGKMSPPASEQGSYAMSYDEPGLHIPSSRKHHGRHGKHNHIGSFDEHLEDMSMPEDEADKMSLDGDSAMDSDEDDSVASDSAGDETEEEDWSAIGADALRKASVSTAASPSVRRNYNLISIPGSLQEARRPSYYSGVTSRSSYQGRSTPTNARRPSMIKQPSSNLIKPAAKFAGMLGQDQTTQEREAIEALLRMGSM